MAGLLWCRPVVRIFPAGPMRRAEWIPFYLQSRVINLYGRSIGAAFPHRLLPRFKGGPTASPRRTSGSARDALPAMHPMRRMRGGCVVGYTS